MEGGGGGSVGSGSVGEQLPLLPKRSDVGSVSRGEGRDRRFFNRERGFRRYPPLLLPAFSTIQSVLPFVPLSPWRRHLFVATLFSSFFFFFFFPSFDTPQLKGIRALTSATQPSRGLVLFAYPASSVSPPDNLPFFSSPLLQEEGRAPSSFRPASSPFVFIARTESYTNNRHDKSTHVEKDKIMEMSHRG